MRLGQALSPQLGLEHGTLTSEPLAEQYLNGSQSIFIQTVHILQLS
jgi:hypothetical protein